MRCRLARFGSLKPSQLGLENILPKLKAVFAQRQPSHKASARQANFVIESCVDPTEPLRDEGRSATTPARQRGKPETRNPKIRTSTAGFFFGIRGSGFFRISTFGAISNTRFEHGRTVAIVGM